MVYQSEIVVNKIKEYRKEELLKKSKEELVSVIFSLHSNIFHQRKRIYIMNYLKKNNELRINKIVRELEQIKNAPYGK